MRRARVLGDGCFEPRRASLLRGNEWSCRAGELRRTGEDGTDAGSTCGKGARKDVVVSRERIAHDRLCPGAERDRDSRRHYECMAHVRPDRRSRIETECAIEGAKTAALL